ncbi:ACT domain-containing protein [Lacrimispora aerotolerans]|uniref:ACT domain-containing protein n=1 Tax=Lacrimispora aerotolerans TaxID=36832 RepID=UPI00047887D4|nr:ACT domain-containing protein [Lacrimispora aerotolerans]
MELKEIQGDYTVCKISGFSELTQEIQASQFWFFGKTDEELSLVCETALVPKESMEREDGFRAFRIEGTLDFSLTGILSRLSTVLADHGIGIFAVSTFQTDYILVKKENYKKAMEKLIEAGYTFP